MNETFVINISALQHYAYCPRQFALIHVERAWSDNQFTAEGHLLHKRVDSGFAETRGSVRSERGVSLESKVHGIAGKMDLLEIEGSNPPKYFPVEYKRGKPKIEDWDRIQLCAQAICIEEMRNVKINEGAIWYCEIRKREQVSVDDDLRKVTIQAIKNARTILESGSTPKPTENKSRCRACSLIEICAPDAFRSDQSAKYVLQMFQDEGITDGEIL